MPSTIITKNSSTASSVPSAGSLTQGELAVNVADKRLYTKDSGGIVVELGTNPASLTMPNGTANTVPYLNGSKVVTSGSALSFDGSNLGLGVTPSAWFATSRILQIGSGGAIESRTNFNPYISTTSNAYLDTAGTYRYIGSAEAGRYLQSSGVHSWYNAASGTAGNAITFTQAMTLDASGRLLLGTTTAPSGGSATQVISASNGGLQLHSTSQTGGALLSSAVASGGLGFYTYTGNVGSESYSERARIDSSGDFIVGTSGTGRAIIAKQDSDGEGWNGASTALYVGKVNGTGRSINAGGTINASGADYAEYMTKAGNFTVAKGDLVGIDAQGKLTNVFANALSFVVKSTDPSYVGGDIWGVGLEGDELEAARQTVDRIAFAGQVPVNVLGATAGQFIIPVNDNGSIKGQAVSNPTFEQYQFAVGKVIAIESDGRARIIVKVA